MLPYLFFLTQVTQPWAKPASYISIQTRNSKLVLLRRWGWISEKKDWYFFSDIYNLTQQFHVLAVSGRGYLYTSSKTLANRTNQSMQVSQCFPKPCVTNTMFIYLMISLSLKNGVCFLISYLFKNTTYMQEYLHFNYLCL